MRWCVRGAICTPLLASKDGFTEGYALGKAPFPEPGIVFRGHNGEIDSFTAVFGYRRDCDCGNSPDCARPASARAAQSDASIA